jgi:hypothetical protein
MGRLIDEGVFLYLVLYRLLFYLWRKEGFMESSALMPEASTVHLQDHNGTLPDLGK